jgi:hypothetical protein
MVGHLEKLPRKQLQEAPVFEVIANLMNPD